MPALLDTGFLLAVIEADDNLHAACTAALESETNPILPDVVLPELAYLILRELGYPTLTSFLRAVVAGELAQAQSTPQDLARAAEERRRIFSAHFERDQDESSGSFQCIKMACSMRS